MDCDVGHSIESDICFDLVIGYVFAVYIKRLKNIKKEFSRIK